MIPLLIKADRRELCSLTAQRVEGDAKTRKNHTADVVAGVVDNGECRRCSHVDDDDRAWIVVDGGNCVDDHITADGFRVVHQDVHSGLDACTDEHRVIAEDLLHSGGDYGVQRRDNGGEDRSLDLRRLDVMDLENIFDVDRILGTSFIVACCHALHKVSLFIIDTADDNVCITHIDCQYHIKTPLKII